MGTYTLAILKYMPCLCRWKLHSTWEAYDAFASASAPCISSLLVAKQNVKAIKAHIGLWTYFALICKLC